MLNWDTIGLSILDRVEERFDTIGVQKWMQSNWQISVYASLFYIAVISIVRRYMRNRNRYELRKALTLWSLSLALFSIAGVYRISSWVLHQQMRGGIVFTVCDTSYYHVPKYAALWGFLFVFSKVLELGDSLFIVLRKNPLIFLHWYHHVTVLVYCWYFYAFRSGLCKLLFLKYDVDLSCVQGRRTLEISGPFGRFQGWGSVLNFALRLWAIGPGDDRASPAPTGSVPMVVSMILGKMLF